MAKATYQILSNEAINSKGFVVLNSSIDWSRYLKNPILLRNKYNVLDVLREHIHQLQIMRRMIERDDAEGLKAAFDRANSIQRIIH